MGSPSSPGGPSAYLESLMQAGQQATRQFDDALPPPWASSASPPKARTCRRLRLRRTCIGSSGGPRSISGAASSTGKPAQGTGSSAKAPRGDRRFKDDAWTHSPFYELLKQSYLLGSKQLTELVDQAQVDDKAKLQLRFYARQFIDAMSPSNFPATNPEVIRSAIQTRSKSSGGRHAEPDRGSAEGPHHAGG